MSSRIHIRLDAETVRMLAALATAKGLDRSSAVRLAIHEGFMRLSPAVLAEQDQVRKAKQAAKALAAQERELVREHRASSIAKRIAAHAVAAKEIQDASHAVAEAEKARDTLAGRLAKGLTSPEDLEGFAAAQARVSDALSVRVRKLQKVLSKPKLFTPRSREPERLRRMLVSDQTKLASLANTR